MSFSPEVIQGGRTAEDSERDAKLLAASEFLDTKKQAFIDAGIDLTNLAVRTKTTDLFIAYRFKSFSFAKAIAGEDPESVKILEVIRSILGGPAADEGVMEQEAAAG